MYIEHIKFERTGGFAGIRLAADIELDKLPEDQKREILDLLDEMDFDDLPEKLEDKKSIPDEFIYSIVVVSSKKEYKVVGGTSVMPDKMTPLIEILEQFAKRQARKK
ncbi:MAG: hypothetical protein IPP66_21645 [Anaerolineales bacterium]|nr:hypothetical protein [Anaerolineales bacterium]